MKVYCWPVGDQSMPAEDVAVEVRTIDELWELVTERTDPVQSDYVHEISAGQGFTHADGTPGERFLVLAWVETEEATTDTDTNAGKQGVGGEESNGNV